MISVIIHEGCFLFWGYFGEIGRKTRDWVMVLWVSCRKADEVNLLGQLLQ